MGGSIKYTRKWMRDVFGFRNYINWFQKIAKSKVYLKFLQYFQKLPRQNAAF
jgi:hypothetical protein